VTASGAADVPIEGPVVFFTGAGISVGSGLPTYRGTGGLYEASDLEPPKADDVTPERLPLLWARFRPRLQSAEEVQPSAAHLAIAALEQVLASPVSVVTQNVDGLHSAAGSMRVIELHGTLQEVRCLGAGHVHGIAEARWGDDGVPRCPACGAMCRPGVVLFGEALPEHAWIEAGQALESAVTVVAVGTSAQVYPAAWLIDASRLPHATRIWINPETPPPDNGWTWLQGDADTHVARLRA
jgi:NAD-dependent deacetylase